MVFSAQTGKVPGFLFFGGMIFVLLLKMWEIIGVITICIIAAMIIINNYYSGSPVHHKKCKKHTGYFSSLQIKDGSQSLISIKGKIYIMALSLKDTQQASGTLAFVDKKGASTDVPDGNVTITSSDENVATVTYDDPTNTVTVVAGQPGVASLTIDAKDSQGNQLPFDLVAVEVTAGDAASGTISFSAPIEQP